MKTSIIIPAVSLLLLSSCGSQGKISDNGDPSGSSYLEEEINVGYGRTKRGDLSYSVSKVEIDEKQISSYTSIWDYLNGRVAGVHIGNAENGGTPEIRIRGISSINLSNQPLLIVDGVETADISYLSPHDIASVEVLKDASASIYGSRGANGVILFTTKSAQEAAQAEAAARKAERQAEKEKKKAERRK